MITRRGTFLGISALCVSGLPAIAAANWRHFNPDFVLRSGAFAESMGYGRFKEPEDGLVVLNVGLIVQKAGNAVFPVYFKLPFQASTTEFTALSFSDTNGDPGFSFINAPGNTCFFGPNVPPQDDTDYFVTGFVRV